MRKPHAAALRKELRVRLLLFALSDDPLWGASRRFQCLHLHTPDVWIHICTLICEPDRRYSGNRMGNIRHLVPGNPTGLCPERGSHSPQASVPSTGRRENYFPAVGRPRESVNCYVVLGQSPRFLLLYPAFRGKTYASFPRTEVCRRNVNFRPVRGDRLGEKTQRKPDGVQVSLCFLLVPMETRKIDHGSFSESRSVIATDLPSALQVNVRKLLQNS